MKETFVLLFIFFTNLRCISQTNFKIDYIKKEILENFPKSAYELSENFSGYRNIYRIGSKDKKVFKIISKSVSKDTIFSFMYVNREIRYCEFIKMNKKKRIEINHIYFMNNEIIYSSDKFRGVSDTLLFLKKGKDLLVFGENFCLRR
jgi:hypothetical protein